MFCPQCGAENLDSAKFCKSCGCSLAVNPTAGSANSGGNVAYGSSAPNVQPSPYNATSQNYYGVSGAAKVGNFTSAFSSPFSKYVTTRRNATMILAAIAVLLSLFPWFSYSINVPANYLSALGALGRLANFSTAPWGFPFDCSGLANVLNTYMGSLGYGNYFANTIAYVNNASNGLMLLSVVEFIHWLTAVALIVVGLYFFVAKKRQRSRLLCAGLIVFLILSFFWLAANLYFMVSVGGLTVSYSAITFSIGFPIWDLLAFGCSIAAIVTYSMATSKKSVSR